LCKTVQKWTANFFVFIHYAQTFPEHLKGRSPETQVNLKSTTVFLALALAAAAPAFADKIPTELRNGEALSDSAHQLLQRDASTLRFYSDDAINHDVIVPADSWLDEGDSRWNAFAVGTDNGYARGINHDHARRNHKGTGWDSGDPLSSSVAVPEPSSQLLLLFGLAGLGILFCRRNSVRQAV
jgi:PEP-CTERM motif